MISKSFYISRRANMSWVVCFLHFRTKGLHFICLKEGEDWGSLLPNIDLKTLFTYGQSNTLDVSSLSIHEPNSSLEKQQYQMLKSPIVNHRCLSRKRHAYEQTVSEPAYFWLVHMCYFFLTRKRSTMTSFSISHHKKQVKLVLRNFCTKSFKVLLWSKRSLLFFLQILRACLSDTLLAKS